MLDLTEDMQRLIRRVHVNMPWKYLPQYMDSILRYRMNVELGFEGVELDTVSRSDLQLAANRLHEAECGISIHGPFWDLNSGSLDPLVRKVSRHRLGQLFDLPALFNPVRLVCHTGYDPRHHRGHRKFWMERSLAAWEPLVRRAEDMKVPLLLENVWEHGPDLHVEIFERLKSPFFGFCLDVGHQSSFSETPLPVWLDALSDRLMEVHLHDNDGTQDAHLPVGQGKIDFRLLFDFLKRKALFPVLTIEPHREEHVSESLTGLMKVMGDYLPDGPGV